MEIDCDFPGGNILVDQVDGDAIAVRQDLRDTHRNWFYWYFRVRGAAGRPLTVRMTGSPAIGLRGPAVSVDGGWSWRWLGPDAVEGSSFGYSVPDDVDDVRFSFGMPYVEADLNRFLAQHPGDSHLDVGTLCTSEKGREVESIRAGRLGGTADFRVLLTARHHACEMMASYALEGVLDAVLAESTVGSWLRDNVEFVIVPFVDKDGVEQGDQGKYRAPHDHNRDYGEDEGIYRSVRAIRELVTGELAGRLDLAFDVHCPGVRGNSIYFVGTPDEANWTQVGEFSEVLEQVQEGPLAHRQGANLPHGAGWNVDKRYRAAGGGDHALMSMNTFLDTIHGIGPHAGMEVAYADADGQEVNTSTARDLGRDLASAMRVYLERRPRRARDA